MPAGFLSVCLASLTTSMAQAQAVGSDPRTMDWKVGADRREAFVFVPPSTRGAPVVFVWHGHGGTSAGTAKMFRIHELWPEAIVVYPQGLPTPGRLTDPEGKKPGWQHFPGDLADRDLRFFDAMLETIQSAFAADPRRVFSTGNSNGGRFTYLLWAARPEAVAAVAPGASPADGLLEMLKPKPCLHIAGREDKLVTFPMQRATLAALPKINHCSEEGKPWGEGRAETVTLYPSTTRTPFLAMIHPGGHGLPKEAPASIAAFFKEIDAEIEAGR